MAKIVIDGKQIECRDGIPVLQAALEAGCSVPHYCYHPGLSIVASCRLCLMELKQPHPQTKELVWVNKLFPACQTPVKDGMEVRFDSDFVRQNQKHVMEYYLLNHPLDCPVCDKAGECYLQDYSEQFGNASSRMIEDKHKNPKKDIGSHTLLYQDRCVLCTRCVRFAGEVAGTGELTVVDRGDRAEIDVFPGVPLENRLQGNVVDLCPVGALLDKDFLFRQRVWMLQHARSVCPGCARGCTIFIDHNEHGIHRVRPRYNEKVNEWWICDDGRFGWRYVQDDRRLRHPLQRRAGTWAALRWEELPGELNSRFASVAGAGGAAAAIVLSPMLACEELWLLARWARRILPRCVLVAGHVPMVGRDETFPKGFRILAEKCPNRRGVERILAESGGATLDFDGFLKAAAVKKLTAAYLTGGYGPDWLPRPAAQALSGLELLVVHDLFPTAAEETAAIQIPSAAWTEREGSFINAGGIVQPFDRVVPPLEGVKADGQLFAELAGETGLYRARRIRESMAASMSEFASVHVPRELPQHAH